MDKNRSLEKLKAPAALVPVHSDGSEVLVLAKQPKFPRELLYNFVGFGATTGDGQVYAFTSVRRAEGVSYVTRLLGCQLADYRGGDVIILSPPDLQRLQPLHVEEIEVVGRRAGSRVWTVPAELPEAHANSAAEEEDLWKVMRRRFRYILLDCSALETSADILTLAPRIDGTILVVQAGHSSKLEIQKAAGLLSMGRAPFLGCILNQRTYPVPGFLYRFL